VAAALSGFEGPVVFDPVLAASSGGRLFEGEPDALLPLARRASLVTPNAREAAALAGGVVETVEEARGAGRRLVAAGAAAVLVKGGHLAGDAVDVLVMRGGPERAFAAPRAPGPAPRGTGCALATAIAVGLARGQDLPDAVAAAKAWLLDRIRAARPVGDERHL
jgi:hydroxymethylpyrimidine/phosphomethylpyrimidine kinase